MTAKEKAAELLDKFRNEFIWVEADYPVDLYRDTKQCAIICVDEIINTGLLEPQLKRHKLNNDAPLPITIEYWYEVKKEIEQVK